MKVLETIEKHMPARTPDGEWMREFSMVANIARPAREDFRRPRRWAGLCLCLTLAACGGAYDSNGGLTKEDYEALKSRRPAIQGATMTEPPIPDLAPVLAAPQPPLLADSRRVTVQATEETPIKDLLIEIARKAGMDLELDPRIDGGIILTANDRRWLMWWSELLTWQACATRWRITGFEWNWMIHT